MRSLLICRHATAVPGSAGMPDFERPLSDQAVEQVAVTAAWLREHFATVEVALVSPALRALQTLALIEQGTGWQPRRQEEPRIYDADVNDLVDALLGVAEVPGPVLLIGHNPGLSELVQWLTAQPVGLATAACASVKMPEDWYSVTTGSGELLDCFEPGD